MKQDFFAPQFGLAARRFAEDQETPALDQPTTSSALAYAGAATFRPSSGPKVVVKTLKRRRLEVASSGTDEAAGSQPTGMGNATPAPRADSMKSPKVFLLAPSGPALCESDHQQERGDETKAILLTPAADAEVPTSLPVVPRRRRRRDPLTAPVLVRHVVFERPEIEDVPRLHATPSGAEGDYATACRALQELREKVENAMRVRVRLAEIDLPRTR